MESYLSDPSLRYLAMRPSAAALRSPVSTSVQPSTPTSLLLATPAPVLALLTLWAPALDTLNALVHAVMWHGSGLRSLLLLCAWWAACLGADIVLRYGLNAALLAWVLFGSAGTSTRAPLTPSAFHALLQSTTATAELLNTLAHSLPSLSVPVLLSSYPIYLASTFFVPLRFLVLAAGTALLLRHSPPIKLLLSLLNRSAHLRAFGRLLVSLLHAGTGITHVLPRRFHPVPVVAEPSLLKLDPEAQDVKIQFTVFENQRWWVGLDWTHALLPGERPSWTDQDLNPSLPPSQFMLPPPLVVYTPSPTRSNPTSQLRTTTEWKWLDQEWSIITASSASLVSFPFPAVPPATAATTASPPPDPYAPPVVGTPLLSPASLLASPFQVDPQGWQYGDNHFEKMGPKGGLGKFTRTRGWRRMAGLVERCERVDRVESEPGVESEGQGDKVERAERKRAESGATKTREMDQEGSRDAELRRRKSTSNSTPVKSKSRS